MTSRVTKEKLRIYLFCTEAAQIFSSFCWTTVFVLTSAL